VFCGPPPVYQSRPIRATPVAAGLTYTNPILKGGSVAPYVFNETVRLKSAMSENLTLQWSGLHDEVAGLPSTLSNSKGGGVVQLATPLHNYQDAFRLTIVGDPSDGIISLATVDGWTLNVTDSSLRDYPASTLTDSMNLTIVDQNVNDIWMMTNPDIPGYSVYFESVSDAQLSRLLEDLAQDVTGWNTPPSNATLLTLSNQPEYSSVCSTATVSSVDNEQLMLVSVANSAIMTSSTSTTTIARTDMTVSEAISYNIDTFFWSTSLKTACAVSNGTPAAVQVSGDFVVLIAGTSRSMQDPNQLGLDSVFPTFTQYGALVPQDWYVGILGQGTNFNGTNMAWYNITLQHPWWLGWYVGVCETCAWGTVGPNGEPETAVVLMESTPKDPRVQWTLLVVNR